MAIQLGLENNKEGYEPRDTPFIAAVRFCNTDGSTRSTRTWRSTAGTLAAVGTAAVNAAKANVAKMEMVENEGMEEKPRPVPRIMGAIYTWTAFHGPCRQDKF